MVIPPSKEELLKKAHDDVREIEEQYKNGLITDGERYNKVVDIWAEVTDRIADEMLRDLGSEKVIDDQGREIYGAELQSDLHDGRLRRARQRAADPPARRHARSDGKALRRNHRDADHGQLPRRPDRVAVLHLDPRRAQRSRRYGA